MYTLIKPINGTLYTNIHTDTLWKFRGYRLKQNKESQRLYHLLNLVTRPYLIFVDLYNRHTKEMLMNLQSVLIKCNSKYITYYTHSFLCLSLLYPLFPKTHKDKKNQDFARLFLFLNYPPFLFLVSYMVILARGVKRSEISIDFRA